jgi:NitT/TauT family transport system substrate-binding protein
MMSELVRISATAAGIAYYPEHVARVLGFFEEEGLDVRTEAPGHGPWVARDIRTGKAELALGGIWRPILYRNGLDRFMPFVQMVWRCPAVVLSHKPMSSFQWTDLIGKRVAIPDGAPTPFVAFVAVLKEKGIDPAKVKLISYFLVEEARDLFVGGACDFYVAGPPAADVLVSKGQGYQVADLTIDAGNLPWSVYYSVPSFLQERRDTATRFACGLQRGLNWVNSHDPEEATAVLEKAWPNVPVNVTLEAVRNNQKKNLWPKTVRVTESHLDRWQKILIEAGLFDAVVPYADIFDDGPAKAAIAKYPPK